MKKVALILMAMLFVLSASAVLMAQGYDAQPADAKIIPLGEEGTAYENQEPGVRGGTMYVASISDPKKWNSVTAHETSTTQYTNMMLRGLVDTNPITGAIEPELAKSWDISEDNLVITFHLREGLKWSDGEPFTADDVVFTFNDLIYNEDVETDTRDILLLPDDTYPVVEKVDDYTVKVTLSMIFRPILNSIGTPILPKHAVAQYVHKLNPDVPVGTFNSSWGLDTDPAELVGMGPFMVESYAPDQHVTLVRNPYYYHYDANGTQLPYFDEYVVLTVASQDVSLLKFRNGELDCLGIRATDVPILKREEAVKNLTVLVDPDVANYGTSWIGINQDIGLAEGTYENLRTLFRTRDFRAAMSHLVDKQAMIDTLFNGLAVPQWSPVSYLSPFYAGRDYYGGPVTETDAVVFEYSLVKAGELLDGIGIIDRDGDGWRDYEDGTRVEIEMNTNAGNTVREGVCLIVADRASKIGLKLNFIPVNFNTLVNKLFASTGEMIVLGLTGGNEPNNGANVYKSSGGLHFWHYSADAEPTETEKKIDELLNAGVATLDNDEAFEIYKEYQIMLADDDLGLVYTVNSAFTYAYSNKIGNANIASPSATPSGSNGLTMDLVFFK
jgi:peptide/nickel transport system substrate-binding protein